MIATMSATTHIRMSPTPGRPFSLASNSAGAPLPLIPRRSAIRSNSTPASAQGSPPNATPIKVVVEGPSPSKEYPKNSFNTNFPTASTAASGITPPVRRRVVPSRSVPTLCPPEHSTPTPAVSLANVNNHPPLPDTGDDATPRASTSKPLTYQPGVSLRLNLDSLKNRSLSESRIDGLSGEDSFEIPPAVEAQLIRKKSGQLVKSSLKRSKSSDRASLSVMMFAGPSKSEPTTPKAVHFDAKLEHVKLFLAQQKPLAVSRDGSPTDDTSGTESDFPSFIFGSADERNARRNLTMKVTNMPIIINTVHDVALEELKLSSDMTSIEGRVRLKNIAYHKQLGVRFTFDAWQTTSEVFGKYSEPINKNFDRFTFSIRLNDLLARIDGKTLLLALRYTVDGQEIWDNNSCQNYQAIFSTKRQPKNRPDDSSSASDAADLKVRLEKVVRGREAGPATPTPRVSRQPGSRSNSSSSSSDSDKPLEFKTNGSLASRYDLGSSLRAPWKSPVPAYTPPPQHSRTRSHPSTSPSQTSIPWPSKIVTTPTTQYNKSKAELGSPRDLSNDDHFRLVGTRLHTSPESENIPFPVMKPPVAKEQRASRNHQRGGYFDVGANFETGVRKTPPGSPKSTAVDSVSGLASPRSISFPPSDGSLLPRPLFSTPTALDLTPRQGLFALETGGDSESSTPTFIPSSESSRSSTPSPTDFAFTSLVDGFVDQLPPANAPVDYRQLIDKFCFYTGTDTLPLRPSSASSVDDFFSSQSPRLQGSAHKFSSPPLTARSNSDDMIVCRSGSATPVDRRTSPLGSRSPTPIAA
ncbi:carbohydrate-binding module family 21 protein [Pleurotus ostreatus PC15]|uniref:Carbohydrate-binding module family 21 protein n=1 Tax=Pleurotus ostreatus (strain PC15) TaxID=1137138 RepID=A0A067P0Y3_PLEO1|nr:carbohydrate-binding module family 21 protein [Pleurotus ostreatus PC15]